MVNIDEIWPGWHAEKKIGQGACGTVYQMSRTEFGHTSYAAAKIIEIPQDASEISALADQGMSELSIKGYFRKTAEDVNKEIAVMDSLKGANNIVAIEDHRLIEHADGFGCTVCIRMELLQSVADCYRKSTPSVDETVKMGIDICRALECCEESNIIHRDIKPENVFINKFGDYKLGDFGIARRIENASKSVYSQKGTIPYMAPEVVHGREYGRSVDEYSLGIMLYRYLNGKRFPFYPPAPQQFTSNDVERALYRRLSGEKVPAPAYADRELGAIVCKACAADPRNRYHSARELREALEAYRRGEGPGIGGNGPADRPTDTGHLSRTDWGTKFRGDLVDGALSGMLAVSIAAWLVAVAVELLGPTGTVKNVASAMILVAFFVQVGITLHTMSKYNRQALVAVALVVLVAGIASLGLSSSVLFLVSFTAGLVLGIVTLVLLVRGLRRAGRREEDAHERF